MGQKWSKIDKKCEKKSLFFKKKSRFSILREIAPVKCHIRKGPEIRWSKNDPKSAKSVKMVKNDNMCTFKKWTFFWAFSRNVISVRLRAESLRVMRGS